MTSSAPSDRTKSIFAVLDTPVTFAPNVFASCIANEPTPPDAPTIRTSCPDWMSPSAESLEGGAAGDRDGGRLLEREVRGLPREPCLRRGRVLREGAVGGAEHRVTGLEPGHVLPHRLHDPGNVAASQRYFGFAQSEAVDTKPVRLAGHDVPDADVDAGRVHAYQHVMIADHRDVDVPEFEHIGGAVRALDDRLHVFPRRLGILTQGQALYFSSFLVD